MVSEKIKASRTVFITAVFSVSLFLACSNNVADTSDNDDSETDVVYLRDYYPYNFNQDNYLVLKSATEKDDFIALKKAELDSLYPERWTDAQLSTFNAYDDKFFAENNLVIIFVIESSGSITHDVEAIDVINDELNIRIKRNIPYLCTDDMADWSILVPVKKDYFNGNKVNVEGIQIPKRQTHIEFSETDVAYLRNFGLNPNGSGPDHLVLKSIAEKDDFVALRRAELEALNHSIDWNLTQLSALDAYNDEFFTENNLIMVFRTEGSGSIRHEVRALYVVDDELNILIIRNLPYIGTDDMAYWSILIPVKKDYFNGDKVNVEMVNNLLKPPLENLGLRPI